MIVSYALAPLNTPKPIWWPSPAVLPTLGATPQHAVQPARVGRSNRSRRYLRVRRRSDRRRSAPDGPARWEFKYVRWTMYWELLWTDLLFFAADEVDAVEFTMAPNPIKI